MMFPLSQSINFKTKYELFHHDHNKKGEFRKKPNKVRRIEMKNETRR
jgi:hypothetical protein